jgi:hypothetical protein
LLRYIDECVFQNKSTFFFFLTTIR